MSEAPIAQGSSTTLTPQNATNRTKNTTINFHVLFLCFFSRSYCTVLSKMKGRLAPSFPARHRRSGVNDQPLSMGYLPFLLTLIFLPSLVGKGVYRWLYLACFGCQEGAEQGAATTIGYVGSDLNSRVRIQHVVAIANRHNPHSLPLSFLSVSSHHAFLPHWKEL